MKETKKILNLIYQSATGSIKGLPAIPEKRFKKLSKEIVELFNSNQYPNLGDK